MKINIFLFISALCLITSACNKSIELNEYVSRIAADADYNKNIESGEYKIQCNFKPSELLALKELKVRLNNNRQSVTVKDFQDEVKKFGNSIYFNISIGLKNKEDIMKRNVKNQQEYARMISELTYNMERDIYIVGSDNDTLRALTYDYSNSYGMKPDIDFLFVFPKNDVLKYKHIMLVYDDKLFGINEKTKFDYKTEELNKTLPDLKLN